MRKISASDAKARFSQILDEAERGESVLITRGGRVVARLVPEAHRQEDIDQAIETLKALGRRTGKITLQDLLSARHEGRE